MRACLRVAILLPLFTLALASFANAARAEPLVEEVTYGEADGQPLRLLVVRPEAADAPEAARPAVVFFHGGAWTTGEPEGMLPLARAAAEEGMVGISAGYRLRDRPGRTPLDSVRDAFDAMRHVRSHAAELGVDPARIAAAGHSAGGHLAAATATLTAEDLAGDEAARELARPDALFLVYPVYDNGPEGRFGHGMMGPRWEDASPAHHLHAGMGPVMVVVGDRDKHVPVSTARRFDENLQKLGVSAELIVYDGGEHGFGLPGRGDGTLYRRMLGDMRRFFGRLGWIHPAGSGTDRE